MAVKYYAGLAENLPASRSYENFYRTTDTNELYIGMKKITNAADLEALANRIGANADLDTTEKTTIIAAINELKGVLDTVQGSDETVGSFAKAIKDAINGLDVNEVSFATVTDGVVTIKGLKEVDGKIALGDGAGISLAKVATSGAAADVSVADADGKITATTVEGALAELADSISDLNTASEVTVEQQATAETGYAATYVVKQNNTQVGVKINIPKDFLVKSATLETVIAADVPYAGAVVGDKYIDFVVNAKDSSETAEHIYLPVKDLVDVYTAEQNATQIQLTIDANNEISAVVVAGSIGTEELDNNAVTAAKLANNAVETAKILDANVTKAKLAQGVQDSLDLADTAVQPGVLTSTIENLDANESQAAGADGLALQVVEVDGVITSISGSIAANTYDAHGAAAGVLGTASDAATDNTVYGAKALANANKSDVIGTNGDAASADTIYGAKAYADAAVAAATIEWETFPSA